MKVLFVIHHLKMGGAETIVTNYALQMKKMGIEVAVLDIWHFNTILFQKLKNASIPVFSIFKESNIITRIINHLYPSKTSLNERIMNVISEYKPDVVHFHTFLRDTQIDKNLCPKWFFTLHTDVNRFLSQFDEKGIDNFSDQLSEGLQVLALTDKMKKDLLEFNGNAHVTVIPNGLDIKSIQSQKYDKEKLLKELNLPMDTFILGHVGRFNKVKNHEKLINIFRSVLQKHPQSVLLLVGDGDKNDRKRVHGLVEEYSLQDRVIFLGVRKDAIALMSCFDAMALPSYQESFSLVLVEAQAQGVRCVASDTVPDEVICTDKCFKLSVNESNKKWANLLLSSCVRENNVKSVNYFDFKKVLSNILSLYQK